LPEHIVVKDGLIETIGVVFTMILTLSLALHPLPLVPTTVYVVVTVGLTDTVLPVVELIAEAGLHAYDVAPPAVSVVEVPEQMVEDGDVPKVTLGVGLTAILTLSFALHPLPFVPLTTYSVITVGVTVTILPEVELIA
jgi:hypothetical protein